MNFQFDAAAVSVIRQALMLRAAQLRRAIDKETDSSILSIRQQQFRYVDGLIQQFAQVKS